MASVQAQVGFITDAGATSTASRSAIRVSGSPRSQARWPAQSGRAASSPICRAASNDSRGDGPHALACSSAAPGQALPSAVPLGLDPPCHLQCLSQCNPATRLGQMRHQAGWRRALGPLFSILRAASRATCRSDSVRYGARPASAQGAVPFVPDARGRLQGLLQQRLAEVRSESDQRVGTGPLADPPRRLPGPPAAAARSTAAQADQCLGTDHFIESPGHLQGLPQQRLAEVRRQAD